MVGGMKRRLPRRTVTLNQADFERVQSGLNALAAEWSMGARIANEASTRAYCQAEQQAVALLMGRLRRLKAR